jgi:hypothetical protein
MKVVIPLSSRITQPKKPAPKQGGSFECVGTVIAEDCD